MDYAQIKSRMNTLRREVSGLKRQKTAFEKELGDIAAERGKIDKNYQLNYTKKAQQAKSAYKAKLLSPFEGKLEKLNGEMAKLDERHKEELEGVSEGRLLENCSTQKSILTEIRESSEELNKVIVDTVGEPFCTELYRQLERQGIVADDGRLEEIVAYFNTCAGEIGQISARAGRLSKFIGKVQGFVMDFDTASLEGSNKVKAAVCAIVLLMIALCYRYVYPFYVLLLFLVVWFNVVRNYKILKIMLIHKSIVDNVQEIEDMLHKKILEESDRKSREINDAYEREKKRIAGEIAKVTDDIHRTGIAAESSFVFDGSDVRESYELAMRQKQNRENSVNGEIRRISAEIESKGRALDGLKKEMEDLLGNVQGQYLDPSKIGDSFELDTKFFMDVIDNRPIFFDHPMATSLFLYDDASHVHEFIRLVNFQLRGKLNPVMFTVDIFDMFTIGKDYLKFKVTGSSGRKDDEAVKRLFKIITTKDGFKSMVEAYDAELSSRVKDITAEFGDIVAYNKFMLSNDSLTVPYIFCFLLDVAPQDLEDPRMVQLLLNGGDVGIFFHIFMKQKVFVKVKDQSKVLADRVEKFFVLEKAGPKTRAKDWVLSLLDDGK